MEKLTQKEYIARLGGTYFIACCSDTTVEEVVQHIASEDGTLPAIYKVDRAQLRSKDMVMHYSNHKDGSENGKSYRQFHGKNSYYAEDDLLLHENIQDGYRSIFLNL